MSTRRYLVLATLFGLGLAAFAWWLLRPRGQAVAPVMGEVLLANRHIVVSAAEPFPVAGAQGAQGQSKTRRGTLPYVLIANAPVTKALRQKVASAGCRVVGYLPTSSLLIEADPKSLASLADDSAFITATEYLPGDKVQAQLRKVSTPSVKVVVSLLNAEDNGAVLDFILAKGGRRITDMPSAGKLVVAEIPTELIAELSRLGEVKWIERFGRLTVSNDQAVMPQCLNVTPVRELHGLTGNGQVIATLDTGIDTGSSGGFSFGNKTQLNEDFSGRISKIYNVGGYTTADYCGHGTHTAGSLVGTGSNSSGTFKGVAYGAKLFVMAGGDKEGSGNINLNNLSSYEEVFNLGRSFYGYGVKSDSWGNASSVSYDTLCTTCDEVIWNDPELLEVIAAGNDGSSASSIDSPGSAKNCMTVGATGNRRHNASNTISDSYVRTVESYSSRGPTADGRIKPDVCAPGRYVVSVLSAKVTSSSKFETNEKYQYMSGTSMATPLAAGCAALVREWLMKYCGYGSTKPTAALMKAILTGGAEEISSSPNNASGWGKVDLEASIFPTNGIAVYLKDRIPFEANSNFVFTVTTTNTAPLRAQLVWIDYPGEESAAKAIVNDLDLTVESYPAGDLWYGNGGSSFDRINTVESVRLKSVSPGIYVVRINCANIAYDYTEGGAAALYLRGAFDPGEVVEGEPSESKPAVYYLTHTR